MKKLLLAALIPFSLCAEIRYDNESGLYYSTKLEEGMDKLRYHSLAQFCNMLIEAAKESCIDMECMKDQIKAILIQDGSREAELLFSDIYHLLK